MLSKFCATADVQDLNGELKILEERQGLELGPSKASSLRGGSSREVMRTGSSIPELTKLVERSALERRSERLEPLDTIGEDDVEATADRVRLASSPVSRVSPADRVETISPRYSAAIPEICQRSGGSANKAVCSICLGWRS